MAIDEFHSSGAFAIRCLPWRVASLNLITPTDSCRARSVRQVRAPSFCRPARVAPS